MAKKANNRCYNCKFGGQHFKIKIGIPVTHLHCENETLYPREKMLSNEENSWSPWDSLRTWSDGCKKHELKSKK